MTITGPGQAQTQSWLSVAGLAIMAVAFAWWLLFCAQWTGPLRLLDLRVPCLVYTTAQCGFFQSRLDEFHASGPAYRPAVWWVGMATYLGGRFSGIVLGRGAKKDGMRQ